MKLNWKVILVALVAAAVGFTLQGQGPVGNAIWPPAVGPEPEGANLALLITFSVIEAIAFGVGVAFLVFAYPAIRRLATSGVQAVAVLVSIGWLFVNWVPHTALHMNHGNILVPGDFAGLVGIEYGFHGTMLLAAAVILHFVLGTVARAGAKPAGAGMPPAKPRAKA